MAKLPFPPSLSGLAQHKSPKTQTPVSKANLISGQRSSPMSAETLVKRSPRLIRSDQKMENLPKCIGSAGNSVQRKQTRKSQPSASEALSSEQQALHLRRSPRLVDKIQDCSRKIANSAAGNDSLEKIKRQQPPLHLTSPRRSPRLINNEETKGKRLNSARQNGLAEKSRLTKRQKIGKGSLNKREYSFFVGDPVPDDEARSQWPWRYEEKKVQSNKGCTSINDDNGGLVLNVKCLYSKAEILKCVFNIGDCAYVKGEEGGPNYVGRILEFFETLDGEKYFRVQWFFREKDTVIQDEATSHDKRRLFYSALMNDNLLDCIVSKVQAVQIKPSTEDADGSVFFSFSSGCGAMSTGLCLGAKVAGVDLVTKWVLITVHQLVKA